MMPRPFPFPFNIGTDICSIPRVFNILKGTNGRRFVRRVLNERERHEGLERLDGPLERWKLAGRVSSVLEWKRKELGLTVKELNKRRFRVKGRMERLEGLLACSQGEMAEDGGKGKGGRKEGRKIRSTIREQLRRELEREIRAEEEAERKLVLETEEGGVDGEKVLMAREHAEMEEEGEESAVEFGREETIGAVKEVVVKKEGLNTRQDEVTPEQKKLKRLEDADIMIRLLEDNDKELETAGEGLWRAAEFLAGRFAAKEAAIKAHHTRKLTYHSIAIHRPPGTDPSKGSQPPVAVILPESGNWEEGQEAKISISHDGEYATAVCLAFEPGSKGGDQMQELHMSQTTSGISETSKHIYTQLEMDDMEPEEEEDEHRWRETEAALAEKDEKLAAVNDPRCLVKVEDLAPDVTAEDLLELFKGKSDKVRAHIAIAADGNRRGYGIVSFASSREAMRARSETDRTLLKGKKITCRWMGGKKARTRGLGMGGKRIFKGEGIGPWVEYVEPGDGERTEVSVSGVAETTEK